MDRPRRGAKLKTGTLASILCFAAFSARAAEVPARNWSDEAELSFTNTAGNSRAATFAADNSFLYDWERASVELKAGVLVEKEKGRVTGEQYDASEKVVRKAAGKLYLYELFRWDRDRFSGVRERYGLSAGGGEELLRTGKDRLVAEIGTGYVFEERTDRRDDFQSIRLYARYVRTLSPTARFSQDAEYLHSVADERDYRFNAETAVTAAVSGKVSLKVSCKWKRLGSPSPGFVKDDTTTGVALIIGY